MSASTTVRRATPERVRGERWGTRPQATRGLRAATGIADERLLGELRDLGLTPETVRLLHLLPLVEVAWSSGGVTRRERKLITDLAELRGIRYGSEAFELLRSWLSERPPERLFAGALAVIRASLDDAPGRVREHTLRLLALHCTQVAAASRETADGRGTICDDEQRTLEAILATLGVEAGGQAVGA